MSATKRLRVGSWITHDDEIDYAPVGIGKNSYVVIPEQGPLELASIGVVNESGQLEFWVKRDIPVTEAMHWLSKNGKPKDWDPDDECDD